MRTKIIETVIKRAEELSTVTDNLQKCLSRFEDAIGQSFDVKKTIRGADSSVSQIAARIYTIVGAIAEFRKATSADLVPLSILTNLQRTIDETILAADGLMKQVEYLQQSQSGLQSFNYGNFQALAKNGNNLNMEGYFQALHSATEGLLQHFFESQYVLKPRGSYSFQAAANALSSTIEDANDTLVALRKSLKQVSVSADDLTAKQDLATTQLDEIKRLKTDSDSDRKTIAEYLAQATQERTSIQTVSEEASKLQVTIKNYQQSLDQFQQKLDDREDAFSEGSEKLSQLIESFEKQRSLVSALITQSEKMLSSATVAGLAANFSAMRDKLTKELRWARAAFYMGIAFLTISAFPLLAFVLMPIAAPILQSMFPSLTFTVPESAPVGNGWQYLGQVSARVAILLPAGARDYGVPS